MTADSTPTGIPAVGPVPWGSHFCQLYDTPRDMADVLVPYFKAGLERNELCHWVTSDHFTAEDAKSALRTAYPDLDRALAAGQITILDRRDWYQKGGAFRPEDVVGGWLAHEEAARARGYGGYRLTGDTLWLEPHQWDEFTRYEELVNQAFGSRRIVALCTYCMGRCGAGEVLDVVNNHNFAVARRRGAWTVVESPSIKAAKAELAELNASLAARVEAATGELRDLVGQKDALLREVHHRVKNNLQIVANLLTMKSRNAPPEARQALLETSDRVHAIGAVHEALYERAGESGVLLAERLRVIAEHLIASYGAGGRVTVEVEDADLRLSLAASIPLALLATELASNALKHAFPGDRPGRIEIGLRRSGPERFELTVTDNGVGWTPEAARKGSGLGIALALAKQLGGELTIESRPGGGLTAALRAPVQ